LGAYGVGPLGTAADRKGADINERIMLMKRHVLGDLKHKWKSVRGSCVFAIINRNQGVHLLCETAAEFQRRVHDINGECCLQHQKKNRKGVGGGANS
jgi:hypothetical protein